MTGDAHAADSPRPDDAAGPDARGVVAASSTSTSADIADLRGGEWLDAGILKAFADGVVEARTAHMLDAVRGRHLDRPARVGGGPARCLRGRGGPARLAARDPRHRRRRRSGRSSTRTSGRPRPTRRAIDAIAWSTSRPSTARRHPAVRAARRRRLHAAVPRRSVAQPDRRVGRQHRPGTRRPGLVVGVDPSSGRRRGPRLGLAGRAVRPDDRAQLGGQSTDRGRLARPVAGCHRRSCRCPKRSRPTGTDPRTRPSPTIAAGRSASGADADLVVLDRDILDQRTVRHHRHARWLSPSSAGRSCIARRSCHEAFHHRRDRGRDRVLRPDEVPADRFDVTRARSRASSCSGSSSASSTASSDRSSRCSSLPLSVRDDGPGGHPRQCRPAPVRRVHRAVDRVRPADRRLPARPAHRRHASWPPSSGPRSSASSPGSSTPSCRDGRSGAGRAGARRFGSRPGASGPRPMSRTWRRWRRRRATCRTRSRTRGSAATRSRRTTSRR